MFTTSWCGLDLTFDLTVVIQTFKIILVYILETMRCRKLILGRNIVLGVYMRNIIVCHWFDRGSARMIFTVIFEIYFYYHEDSWIAVTDSYIYQEHSLLLPYSSTNPSPTCLKCMKK